ncbi:MAG: tetratricopeptide repeat protein [Spirochaetaceae bacterium]|jgi:tetratricopeptide (TPR) repeat protein|nr:tetratricopeptide repeat protein [Spirochaetaceae bacterium]
MNAEEYSERGDKYFREKDFDLAIKDFTEAIRLDPNFTAAYITRGLSYLEKQKIAVKSLQGLECLKRENYEYDLAISDFTEVIRLIPNDAIAYYRRAFVYIKKNIEANETKAIADLTEAICIDPNFVQAYNLRAYIYSSKPPIMDNRENLIKNYYNPAIADFTEIIRITPNDADTYFKRSRMYDLIGDNVRAEADRQMVERLKNIRN